MREKNQNIELIRVISCIMVVFIHTANYFCRGFEQISMGEYTFSLAINAVSRVSVPCFFMISGSFLLSRQDTVKKSLKKALHFLLVLGVWSIIYYLFNTFYTHQKCEISKVLYVPTEAHLWYLYVLISIYVILPFLQSMVKGLDEKAEHAFAIIGGVWILITALLPMMNQRLYYNLPIFGSRSFVYYFYLGYYIKKYLPKIRMSVKRLLLGFCINSAVLITYSAVHSYILQDYSEDLAYGNPLVVLNSALFFTMILKLKDGNLKFKEKGFVSTISKCSFGIYLAHIIFLDIYKIHFSVDSFSVYITLPILTIAVFLLTFGMVYFWEKIVTYIKHLVKK